MSAAIKRIEDRGHLGRVANLGCLICWMEDGIREPAEAHHIREGVGGSQRAHDQLAVPLCPRHHRTGGAGVAIHGGIQSFERVFRVGELDLLAVTIEALRAGSLPARLRG